MPEVLIPAERMLPEERVAHMRELLSSIATNDMTDVEELGTFLDVYKAHDVPKGEQITFYESLDVPEHNIIFGDSTFDTILEAYDALGGMPREQVPLGATAIPSELEVSLGEAYVAVATAANFLQTQEIDATEPEILIKQQEFDEFAEERYPNKRMSGKAWSALTWRFLLRVQPERFENDRWYKREDYTDFPANLFAGIPSLDTKIYRGNYTRKVTGLRLGVLEDLLAKIEPTGVATIQEMLGSGTGPRTLQFLKDFVDFKRQGPGEDSQSQ